MKIVKFNKIKYIPASHENPQNPGVLKKILLKKDDLIKGRVQVINWAKLLPKKAFIPHYHQDMQEIFILLSGKAKMIIGNNEKVMEKGDIAIVPLKAVHSMKNETDKEIEYIVMGITTNKNGKTVIVEKRR